MVETTIKVNGMMCGGCENRVKNALKELAGIESVEASFAEGIVRNMTVENVVVNEI